MDLTDYLEKVHDENSFLDFARQLLNDRLEDIEKEKVNPSNPYGSTNNGWENITIENFLEASISWAEDSKFGKYQGDLEPDNLWKKFAVFLYCGKIYE